MSRIKSGTHRADWVTQWLVADDRRSPALSAATLCGVVASQSRSDSVMDNRRRNKWNSRPAAEARTPSSSSPIGHQSRATLRLVGRPAPGRPPNSPPCQVTQPLLPHSKRSIP